MDPMERLIAADPRPDAERLTGADEAEADALLASILADTPQPAPAQRRRRPWMVAAAATACAAAIALGAVSLLDDDVSGPGVAERAAAAVTDPQSIFHIVSTISAVSIGGAHERPVKPDLWYEAWYAPNGAERTRYFESKDGHRGKLSGEMAGRLHPRGHGRFGGPLLIYLAEENQILHRRFGRSPNHGAPSLTGGHDPGIALRALEREGRLRYDGKEDVDGHTGYRLISGPVRSVPKGNVDRYEYVVDAKTYYPLLLRQQSTRPNGHGFRWTVRYLTYERIPFDAAHRHLLKLAPHPGAKEYDMDGKRIR
jgi:hypothetical protein